MCQNRFHKWVLDVLTRLFPGRYGRRQLPVIRPKRRTVTLDIDQFDRRESPTSIFAVDPLTARMVSFAALQEPLPPVVQVAQSSDQHAISAITEASASSPLSRFFWGRTDGSVLGDDGATTTAGSLLSLGGRGAGGEGGSSWWRNEVYGDGARASQTGDIGLLSTLSGEQFKPNLEALPNPQAPFVDPLADFIPLKNKPILSADGPWNGINSVLRPGSDGGNSAGGSGSSTNNGSAGSSSFSASAPSANPFAGLVSNAPRLPTAPVAHAPGSDVAPSPVPPVSPSPVSFSAPSGPSPNKPKAKDPFWVLDANKAIVVTPGTTENEFSNTAMDLRMQVSGATVSTYSWDLTGAPDTTGVSGTSTYNLTFTWSSFTGAARTDTIVAKETPQGGSQVTQTLTFLVAGTNSPAWSTPPTSYGTWPNVLTPDMLVTMQALQCCGSYGFLGLTAGDLQYAHNLPGYNPGVPGLGLMYDSIAANTLPIFITHFQIDPNQAVPPTVTAQLTLNGTAGTTVWYSTSSLNPGDIMQIPLQGDATGLSTGRYSWSIAVTANYGTPVTTNYSGSVDIVNSSGSPFGAGWSLNVLERVWPVTGGVILELPGGLSLWFANGTPPGSFTPPPGETSKLALANNVYTRTLKDGTKINFNSSGLQTSIVDTNNNTLSFGYNGSNQLTTLTDFNTLVTTIAYNGSGKAISITDPATRITTLAYDVGNTKLAGITDPDNAVWGYGYDSAYRLTTLTDPRSKMTSYAYGTGRVTTVTRADNSTLLLTALELQGIPASGTGTQANPATPVLAAGAVSAYTDARNNIWNTRMDWLGLGEPTQQADPLGDLSNAYRDANGFPWLVANPLGQRTRNFFDTLENITEAVNADDTHHQATYNGFSEPLTQTDELGNISTMTYDTSGNLTQMKDALSHITTMTYSSHGFLLTTTDPLSHTTTLGYDSRSRETSSTDALSHTATMAYDSASDMTGQTDMRGNPTTYTFDAEGRLLTTTLPGSPTSTTTNAYDAAGNLTAVTDPLGHTTSYGYDSLNRQITVTDPLSHITTYGLDGNGNQTTVTDALSRITTYTFDSANRLTAVTDANSHTTSYGLDAAGERTTMTDALGHVTSYQYDNRDRQTATLDPLNNEVKNGYDNDSNVTSVTRTHTSGGFALDNGENTTYAFDQVNRKTGMTDPKTNVTSYGYDSANRQTTTTDPLSHTSTSTYDADNRLISVTDALGHTTTYGYDNNGNRTTVTDPLSRTSTYAFDQQNRLITVTDPLTGVTTYAYDQASRQISITDGVGNTTTNAYDNANRLTTVTDPNSHLTTYAYDNVNQLTSVTDRNGRQTTYSYDQVGNKTGETWVGGSFIATYAFDAANRLTVEQDNFSNYTLSYDNSNRLTNVDNNGTPNAPHVSVTYGYDNFDNVTSVSATSLKDQYFGFDADNRLTSAEIYRPQPPRQPVNALVTLVYDSASRLTTVQRSLNGAGNVNTTYAYDNADRLTAITHKSGTTLMTLTYGYDNANQLTSYAGPDGSITYGYDNDGQLTGATGAHNETYSYDKEGNRTLTGYVTGTGNRLTSDGTYSYTYDQDGNMLTQTRISDSQLTSYTWDFRNRLTEVLIKTSGGTTVQDDKFTYDVENRRIGKNTLSGGQSWTIYSGQNPLSDYNSSLALQYQYLYGPGLDFLLARGDSTGVPMWYLTDKLGSVRENADSNGSVIDSITYDTYGNIISETHSSSGDRFKYTSREWDSEIAQYFYRARYYSPIDGRFESEDPWGFKGGDTDLYRYVRNDSTGLSDAMGLAPIPDTVKMGKPELLHGKFMGSEHTEERTGKITVGGSFDWGFKYKSTITDSTGKPAKGAWVSERVEAKEEPTGYFKDSPLTSQDSYQEYRSSGTDIKAIGWIAKGKTDADRKVALSNLMHDILSHDGNGKQVIKQWFVYTGCSAPLALDQYAS
jgi:RHS repeat-associated protein